MTAIVYPFPARLRVVADNLSHRDADIAAAQKYLRNAIANLEIAVVYDNDAALNAASKATKASLFHTLTALGCLTEDRPLRNLLNSLAMET